MEDLNDRKTKAQKEKEVEEEKEEIKRGLKEDPITLRSKFFVMSQSLMWVQKIEKIFHFKN